MTRTISLAGYEPAVSSCMSDVLLWPVELTLDWRGACKALYADDESVVFLSLAECLAQHLMADEPLVGWLEDAGRSDEAELVALLTDPDRPARADAAARVVELLALSDGVPELLTEIDSEVDRRVPWRPTHEITALDGSHVFVQLWARDHAYRPAWTRQEWETGREPAWAALRHDDGTVTWSQPAAAVVELDEIDVQLVLGNPGAGACNGCGGSDLHYSWCPWVDAR